MKVIYGSSFLRDIQRIDNRIDLYTCKIHYEDTYYRYGDKDDDIPIEAIYDKTNKKIKVYFDTAQFIYKEDEDDPGVVVYKAYAENIKFFYKVVGRDENPLLAFRLEKESRFDNIVLDAHKNLFEFSLDFSIKVNEDKFTVSPEKDCIIGCRYFKNISIEDTIDFFNYDISVYSYDGHYLGSRFEGPPKDQCIYITPETVSEYQESIKTRGLIVKIENEGAIEDTFDLYITYKEPMKATLTSSNNSKDTNFLRSIGTDAGISLFKDIKIGGDNLVWLDSYLKYTNREGLKVSSDTHVFEGYSGQVETKREIIRSFTSLIIDPGDWRELPVTKREWVEREERANFLDSDWNGMSFYEYTDPLISSSYVGLAYDRCANGTSKFLNPGELLFGNTDYLLYTKEYDSESQPFKFKRVSRIVVEGTPGASVELLLNKPSINGNFETHQILIGEDGIGTLQGSSISDPSFVRINGIRVVNPGIFTSVKVFNIYDVWEDIVLENKRVYINVKSEGGLFRVRGYGNYIDYEKYMGEYREISRGQVSITSAPEITLEVVEDIEMNPSVNNQWKEIEVGEVGYTSGINPKAEIKLLVKNNKIIEDNKLVYNDLESEMSIILSQASSGIIWKITTESEYIEDGKKLFVSNYLKSKIKSNGDYRVNVKEIKVFTNIIDSEYGEEALLDLVDNIEFRSDNYDLLFGNNEHKGVFYPFTGEIGDDSDIEAPYIETRVKAEYGIDYIVEDDYYESGVFLTLYVLATDTNNSNTWRPGTALDRNVPCLVNMWYTGKRLSNCSFYLVQKPETSTYRIWENLYSNIYCLVSNNIITIFPDESTPPRYRKNFAVIKYKPTPSNTWYLVDNDNMKFNVLDGETDSKRGTSLDDTGQVTIELDKVADKDYIRTINVLDSSTDSLGTLTVAGVSYIPDDWRQAIVMDLDYADVVKSNIVISLEVGGSEDTLMPEDYELTVTKVYVYDVFVKANYPFTVNTEGPLYVIEDDGKTLTSSYFKSIVIDEPTVVNLKFALTRFDETLDFSSIKATVFCGNLSRKITIKKGTVETYHNYLDNTDQIYIINNGALSPSIDYGFISSTTPSMSAEGITMSNPDSIEPRFGEFKYQKHQCDLSIVIPDYSTISNKRYPIKEVGKIIESSVSYSASETIGIGAAGEIIGPLETYLFVRGLDHYIWYSESNSDFSGINLVNVPTRQIIRISPGQTTGNFYLLSRYNNLTFSNHIPGDTTIQRSSYIATLDFSDDWRSLPNPESRTQIQYYNPVATTLNKVNTGGNIYLGKLIVSAWTRIENGRETDILDVTPSFISSVGIDANFIKSSIIDNATRDLELIVYIGGLSDDVFQEIDNLEEWYDVFSHSGEIVFEVGNKVDNIEIISSSVSNNISASYSSEMNILTYDIYRRLSQGVWVGIYDFELISDLCKNIEGMYINYSFKYSVDSVSGYSYSMNQTSWQYGYNHGLTCQCVHGDTSYDTTIYYGIGGVGPSGEYETSNVITYYADSDGAQLLFNAGTVWLKDGRPNSGATISVPSSYTISDDSILSGTWSSGFIEGSGNLSIAIPANLGGERTYIIRMSTGYVNYPSSLEFRIIQEANNYKFNFSDPQIDIYSTGVTYETGVTPISTNYSEEMFNNVSFSCDLPGFQVVGRNYSERWVQFRFNNNYSGSTRQGILTANLPNGLGSSSISAKQGHFSYEVRTLCLKTYYEENTVISGEVDDRRDIRPGHITLASNESADYQFSGSNILGYDYRNISTGLSGYDELWVKPKVLQTGVLAKAIVTYTDGQEITHTLNGYGDTGGTLVMAINPDKFIAKIHLDNSNVFTDDFDIIDLVRYKRITDWVCKNAGKEWGSSVWAIPEGYGTPPSLGSYTTPSHSNMSDGTEFPNFNSSGYSRVIVKSKSLIRQEPPEYTHEDLTLGVNESISVSGSWSSTSNFTDPTTGYFISDSAPYYSGEVPFTESTYTATDPTASASSNIEVTSTISNSITSTPINFKFSYSITKAISTN